MPLPETMLTSSIHELLWHPIQGNIYLTFNMLNWLKDCRRCIYISYHRADSRLAPSQWEMSLLSDIISHWLGANLESALYHILDFVHQKKNTFTMEQPYVLPILFCQCHACWCPGDLSRKQFNSFPNESSPPPPSQQPNIQDNCSINMICKQFATYAVHVII